MNNDPLPRDPHPHYPTAAAFLLAAPLLIVDFLVRIFAPETESGFWGFIPFAIVGITSAVFVTRLFDVSTSLSQQYKLSLRAAVVYTVVSSIFGLINSLLKHLELSVVLAALSIYVIVCFVTSLLLFAAGFTGAHFVKRRM
jgi:chromate transport protein ChrA